MRGSMRFVCLAGLIGILAIGTAAPDVSADPIYKVDYADWDATVVDNKGVTTKATDFGFWTGANIFYAKRGRSKISIPWRKIKSLSIGKYDPVKGYSEAVVITRKGTTVKIQIERFEGRRNVGGNTDFGDFRLKLMDISKLTLHRLSHTSDDLTPVS